GGWWLSWAAGVLLLGGAQGVSAFFFDHVFGFGGADTTFPLLVFVFLVAPGIDYNIFLMTGCGRRRTGATPGTARSSGSPRPAGGSPPPGSSSRARSPSWPRSRRRS